MAIRLIQRNRNGINTYDFDVRYMGKRYRKRFRISAGLKNSVYKDWYEEIIRSGGKEVNENRPLFRTLDAYLDWVKDRKSKLTVNRERGIIQRLKNWIKKDIPLSSFTRRMAILFIEDYRVNNPSGKILTNATLNKASGVMGYFFNKWCREREYCNDNPFSGLLFDEGEGRNPFFLTREQEKNLIQACTLQHQALFLSLAKDAGLRHGEILSLKWDQVNFENKMIHIHASQTKTKRSRVIPILWKEFYNRLVLASSSRDSECVFVVSYMGKPIKTFRKSWQLIKDRCDWLPNDIRIHDLRHQFARKMLTLGVPKYAVQKMLGHANEKMTERYTKLDTDTLVETIRAAIGKEW